MANGSTWFAEFDADGKPHGRELECIADGDTVYRLVEHGSEKEEARCRADGLLVRCAYNGEACRADFAPFVALQAKVVPIKARPPLVPPQPPVCRIFSPPPPPDRSIGHWFGTRRS